MYGGENAKGAKGAKQRQKGTGFQAAEPLLALSHAVSLRAFAPFAFSRLDFGTSERLNA
jgi:hypothetical protein